MRDKQAHTIREGLDQELADREKLYRFRPPERLKVPILVHPAAVDDDVPTDAEVYLAVQGVKWGRSGCPSGMIAEDLKGWSKEAKREKEPEGRRWDLVVRLV